MATFTQDLDAAGAGTVVSLEPGQSYTYAAAGTFTGYVAFQRSRTGGATWDTVELSAADTGIDGTVKNETNSQERYRFVAFDTDGETPLTGTIETSIADVDDQLGYLRTAKGEIYATVSDDGVDFTGNVDVPGVLSAAYVGVSAGILSSVGNGAKNGATVAVTEYGDSILHQSVLTLSDTPVTVANTTGSSFGGVKLYDFPAGRMLVLGVTADLTFNWDGTDIAADGSGDFSMGTTITADATLAGTDVDLLPSTGLLDPFVAGVGTGTGALAAAAQFDGTATAKDLNLNIIIDDADVADGASDIVLVSGTVRVTWINLGDY